MTKFRKFNIILLYIKYIFISSLYKNYAHLFYKRKIKYTILHIQQIFIYIMNYPINKNY